jgi:hypothetical protein
MVSISRSELAHETYSDCRIARSAGDRRPILDWVTASPCGLGQKLRRAPRIRAERSQRAAGSEPPGGRVAWSRTVCSMPSPAGGAKTRERHYASMGVVQNCGECVIPRSGTTGNPPGTRGDAEFSGAFPGPAGAGMTAAPHLRTMPRVHSPPSGVAHSATRRARPASSVAGAPGQDGPVPH